MRRDFIVESEVLSAKAEFLCDNGFDIYFGEALLAENVDSWSTAGRKNVFGDSVKVVEMQAEGGAAGL